jgi:Holliday junction DNA helicase RuvA
MPAEELIPAIQRQDIAKLSTIPGVGRKTAERVTLELREQITSLLTESAQAHEEKPLREDLISALVNLGYQRNIAERTVKVVLEKSKPDSQFEELLKSSLQMISA